MVRKQKDRAILVDYVYRKKKNCHCPECPKASHFRCLISAAGSGRRSYECQDWGDREITISAVVVLSDTGIRKGKAVLWRVL